MPASLAPPLEVPLPAPAGASAAVVDDPLELEAFTRWHHGPDGARAGESSLLISGMVCAACADAVEQALAAVPGVAWARVGAASQRATLRWDPALTRPSAWIDAVRRAGYDAVPDGAAAGRALREAERRRALWRLFVASFCMMQVMMFATPAYVAGPGDLEPDLRQLLNWGSWVLTLPVLLFSAGPFFQGAWRALRQRRMGMDVPVALGLMVTFVASTGATFSPGGPFGTEVYFDSLAMFVAFLLGGRWFELQARQRATQALESALAGLPQVAWRVRGEGGDGSVEQVSVLRLRPGDVVRVPVGDSFPADGLLTLGATRADEALLTGESAPVDKAVGSAVVGGSINLETAVEMRVERAGPDTRCAAIVAMMRDAATQRPALARLADRWAGPFVWVVLLLAAGAAAVWSVVDPTRAVWVAVSVLIVTCPCALSLAAPAALTAAAGGMARHGVLVQRLDAIESLARVRHLFIDKTGTLTEDRLTLREVQVYGALDSAAALQMAATLAGWSRHPLSRALVEAGEATGWRASPGPAVREVAGAGLERLDDDGTRWRLGSAAFTGVALGALQSLALSRNGRPIAAFAFDEVLRPGAAEAMAALQADGVRITLLSGDAPGRARALAERLGLDDMVAGATPELKLAALRQAQQGGEPVAMVGDGVNDAPVLAQADVSLAMGQGALVARGSADAVIVSNRLQDLLLARRRARRALGIARQNIGWAVAYNATCIPLALAGALPPWAAGLGMAGSSLAVLANALRAAR